MSKVHEKKRKMQSKRTCFIIMNREPKKTITQKDMEELEVLRYEHYDGMMKTTEF